MPTSLELFSTKARSAPAHARYFWSFAVAAAAGDEDSPTLLRLNPSLDPRQCRAEWGGSRRVDVVVVVVVGVSALVSCCCEEDAIEVPSSVFACEVLVVVAGREAFSVVSPGLFHAALLVEKKRGRRSSIGGRWHWSSCRSVLNGADGRRASVRVDRARQARRKLGADMGFIVIEPDD